MGVAAPASPNQIRKLNKGELLFAEGENSRAMYLLRTGMIRIFKKKGDAQIEIDTIRNGQILGELAFLDGQPRSASAEALTNCELMEVSSQTFADTMTKIPDWLKLLLKTVVGRMRTASTRIRQLETASTSYDVGKDGKRSAHYIYLGTSDVLKTCSAILLVAARYGEKSAAGTEVRVGLLQRYANQIMQVPVAKVTSMLDVLAQVGVLAMTDTNGENKIYLKDFEMLEQFISFTNEQNLVEPSKRMDVSIKAFLIMGLMVKHINNYPKDAATGVVTINIGEIRKKELGANGKEQFRLEEFNELVTQRLASAPGMKGADDVVTTVKGDEFVQTFKLLRVTKAIAAANEQKGAGHTK